MKLLNKRQINENQNNNKLSRRFNKKVIIKMMTFKGTVLNVIIEYKDGKHKRSEDTWKIE